MKDIVSNIENQVKSCQKLLGIFQDERQLYQEKDVVPMQEVKEILQRKKQVMGVFETQQKIIRQLKDAESRGEVIDKEEKKKLLRDLASVLEQLLVIDHENEKLLRESLGKGGRSSKSQKAPSARSRPALLRQHPFVPTSSDVKSNGASSQKSRMSSFRSKSLVNSKLRHYVEQSNFSAVDSKYA